VRALGHHTTVSESWTRGDEDLLVALHARKSAPSIRRWRRSGRPLVVALTGTDVYEPRGLGRISLSSLEAADRVIVLQPLAVAALPASIKPKARVVHQSVDAPPAHRRRNSRFFDIAVVAHLRPVKDPFRLALASRLLPVGSRIRVLQVGAAMNTRMAARARSEAKNNERYHWLGDLPRARAMRVIAGSALAVNSSRVEGGSNAVGEAVAIGTPVIVSRIAGNLGVLGRNYPGTFALGDTKGLARLISRSERDPAFLSKLARATRARQPLFETKRETRAWKALLDELV
jgi:putative glycosyltransferase (TIGR04348 family)